MTEKKHAWPMVAGGSVWNKLVSLAKYAHCMTHNLTAKRLNAIGMQKNKYVH